MHAQRLLMHSPQSPASHVIPDPVLRLTLVTLATVTLNADFNAEQLATVREAALRLVPDTELLLTLDEPLPAPPDCGS